jgi:hypothetical protein
VRAVRFWLPIGIILVGLVVIALVRDENGLEGGLLLISAGLSVWLLNWFYGFSVRGEGERDREDEARRFYDEHGYWPDEAPPGEAPPDGDPEGGRTERRPADVHKRAAPREERRGRPDRRPRRPSA